MKSSLLICATCLIVAGCSAQTFKFPSLSSALSSWTGFGGAGSGSSSSASSGSSGPTSQASPSSYNGIVREYGRNLMMAMSNIYPTLFKPPQSMQASQPPQQAAPSPFEQAFGAASQYGSQAMFPSQSAPQFTLGGSTFSISPQLPFGSAFAGSGSPSAGPQQGAHSPFSASFGSSINSPSSFGPLSSGSFLQQSLSSFAPSASSYGAAFEAAAAAAAAAANSGSPQASQFQGLNSLSPSAASAQASQQALLSQQPSSTNSINSYAPIPSYNGQMPQEANPSALMMGPSHQSANGQPGPQQHQHQQSLGNQQQQQQQLNQQQMAAAQSYANQAGQYGYRPDIMSIAASAPVPSSNSYMNYGLQSGAPQQMSSSYQQGAYR